MSSRLGTLTLDLIAKTGNFVGPIEKAKKGASSAFNDIRKGANAAGLAFGALSAAAAAASVAIVASSASSAKELRNLANISNTGVEEFQKFAFAARTVGIEQDKLSDILKDVTDRVGDFVQTGGGPLADFFENIAPKIGVTAEQFRNLSGKDALQLYVDSLQKANLSQEEMTFYLEAVASDATALIPLLKDNAAELNNLEERASSLGLVLSNLEVEQLSSIGDEFGILSEVLGVFTDKLAAKFVPIITGMVSSFSDAADGAIDLDVVSQTVFDNIISGAVFVINAIDGLKRVFTIAANALVVTFAGALDVLSGGAAKTLEILNAIPTIRLAIDDESIEQLRDFQRTQQLVAREGLSTIGGELDRELAGDKFKRFVDEQQQAAKSASQALADERKQREESRRVAVGAIGEQVTAQQELNETIKQTAELLSDQSDRFAAPFEQYVRLAQSDLASGSRFFEDRIKSLKELVAAQKRNGENPAAIAEREAIIAQLTGQQAVQNTNAGQDNSVISQLAQQSIDLAKLAYEETKQIAQNTLRAADALVAQLEQKQADPIGTIVLQVPSTGGNSPFETRLQGAESELQRLNNFVNNFTNDAARIAAGG